VELVAAQIVVFVIAIAVALIIGRAWIALAAGIVLAVVAAVIAALAASGDDGQWLDFSPGEAFVIALAIGLFLYLGWTLGVLAATFVVRMLDR
jgi:ribose/xylose/arabinose/galactoside ABC-type transport system permease subunit